MNDTREHAHQLIDRLPETQLSALVGLLEAIVDPVTAALRDAPIDDEPETEEERLAEFTRKPDGAKVSACFW